MKYYQKLKGERLYLSPLNEEDSDIYAKWMNDMDLTDRAGGSASIVSEKRHIKCWKNGRTAVILILP